MITVFTPTYNRAYCLGNLYESLKKQTNKDFEWLVIDDGSTDDTSDLVLKWKDEANFPINYEKIENGGKANAINLGVQKAKGDLFFIVDSDDFLTEDAIEKVVMLDKKILNKREFAGLCFRKGKFSGEMLGKEIPKNVTEATSLEIAYKYGVICDKAEIFYTDVLKKYPFPKIEGCKFCTEALVWNRIARDGLKLKIQDEVIYLCEYRDDGYTANTKQLMRKYPEGFYPCYKELFLTKGLPFIVKIKAIVRYLQCRMYYLWKRRG